MDTKCNTLDELIAVLGGPTKAAAALGESRPTVVTNWRARGKLPAHRFMAHRAALKRLGISAPESLWFSRRPAPAPRETEATA